MNSQKVLGYVRVSTDKQAEVGLSLEAQTEKIRAMAVVRGVPVDEVIVDTASASSLDRPGLSRLLALVDARLVGTVIIAKLDRLTRSVADIGPLLTRLDRRGVAILCVAETLNTRSAIGRAVLHMMVTMSQWEREATGERTRDVLQHKKANGERIGTVPFGAQLVAGSRERLEAAPVEQRILSQVRKWRFEGRTYKQIAFDLTAAGETTRKGTAWRFQYIAHMLRRKTA